MNISTKSLSSVILATSLLLTFSTPVNASEPTKNIREMSQVHQGESRQQFKHKFKKLAKYLQLSIEQREKVKAIFKQAKTDKMAHRETLLGFKEQVKSLLDAPIFDDNAYVELHNQYQNQLTQGALIKVKAKHAMLQILTAEQREKLEKFKGGRGLFH